MVILQMCEWRSGQPAGQLSRLKIFSERNVRRPVQISFSGSSQVKTSSFNIGSRLSYFQYATLAEESCRVKLPANRGCSAGRSARAEAIQLILKPTALGEFGDPGMTRTCDLRFRKPFLTDDAQ
jgi:hypothetical protein